MTLAEQHCGYWLSSTADTVGKIRGVEERGCAKKVNHCFARTTVPKRKIFPATPWALVVSYGSHLDLPKLATG
jgi:hypothetical protein